MYKTIQRPAVLPLINLIFPTISRCTAAFFKKTFKRNDPSSEFSKILVPLNKALQC